MSSAVPIPSASVMLLRESPTLEVLVIRRGGQLAFAADALAFPGGKVDPADRAPAWRAWSQGADGLSDGDLALMVAAARELFEETGVLLACPGPVQVEAAPGALGPVAAALADAGMRLDLGGWAPFARWITPVGSPRRFDTWFFTARAPEGCAPVCDGQEAISAEWMAPADALALADRDEAKLMLPTRMNLRRLLALGSIRAVERAAGEDPFPTIEPVIIEREGRRYVSIPASRHFDAMEAPLVM